jgi:hypothetical protein
MTFLQDWMKYLTQYVVISFEKKYVPSIKECFNTIQREAQRQVTMLRTKNTS